MNLLWFGWGKKSVFVAFDEVRRATAPSRSQVVAVEDCHDARSSDNTVADPLNVPAQQFALLSLLRPEKLAMRCRGQHCGDILLVLGGSATDAVQQIGIGRVEQHKPRQEFKTLSNSVM